MADFRDLYIAFTDVETTGLNVDEHEIISLAVVIRTPAGAEVLRTHWKFEPRWIERATPKALEINGYHPDTWGETVPIEWAMQQFANYTNGIIFAAHNAPFDKAFIKAEMDRWGIKWEPDYHVLDTCVLGWVPCAKYRSLRGVGLAKLCKFYGISNEGAHDAMVDVDRMIHVYDYIVGNQPVRYGCAAWYEKWLGWLPHPLCWWRGSRSTR